LHFLPNPLSPDEQTIAQRSIPFILNYLKQKAVIYLFLSHVGEDYNKYQIADIGQYLEAPDEINKAYYFEHDMRLDGNLRNFMN